MISTEKKRSELKGKKEGRSRKDDVNVLYV